MSFLTAGQRAQVAEFKLRVKIAMITAAQQVSTETQPNPTTKGYIKRHDYATQVLNEPDSKIDAFAFGVASNVAINDASTDSDIQFTVNSLFSSYAGLTANDPTTNA